MDTITTEVVTIGISGMTCGSCQRRVQHALRSVPGVVDATVDLASGTAAVQFQPSRVPSGAIARAVHDAGYEVVPIGIGTVGRQRRGCCS